MYVFIKEMETDEELIEGLNIPKWLIRPNICYRKAFNITRKYEIDKNHCLYIVPKIKDSKIIKQIISKNNLARIVLSSNLKKYENELKFQSENIVKYFILNILEYIKEKTNIETEMQNIYILSNKYNDNNSSIINSLINIVKTTTIVTSDIKKYKKYEDRVFNEYGILLNITNNKRKALKNANVIINLDFTNEDIKKYKMNKNSIIINTRNEKMNIQYFQGIIINNIEIYIDKSIQYERIYNDFRANDIFVAYIINKLEYNEILEQIKENKINIKSIIGNRGIIEKKEFEQYCKNILTNDKKSTNI